MTAPLFLTHDELVEATGYERPSMQLKHLRSRRIRHTTNCLGHPVVTRAAFLGTDEAATVPAQPRLHLIAKASVR